MLRSLTFKAAFAAAITMGCVVAAAPSAQAVTTSVNLIAGPEDTLTGSFGRSGIAAGSFMDTFLFTTPEGMASSTLTSSAVNFGSITDLDFTSTTFNGLPFGIGVSGLNEFRFINSVMVAAGQQSLTVNGISRGNGAYSGTIAFRAVPGPVVGAGLPALLALGGLVWARRRKSAAIS